MQGRESHTEGTQKARCARMPKSSSLLLHAHSPVLCHSPHSQGGDGRRSRGGKNGLGRPPASRQCIASLSHATSAACMAYLPCLCGRAEVKFPPSHTHNARNYSRVLLLNTRCPALQRGFNGGAGALETAFRAFSLSFVLCLFFSDRIQIAGFVCVCEVLLTSMALLP